MCRSKLKKIAQESKTPEAISNYKKQRNVVVKLNRKAKKSYFENINYDNTNKSLWDICKPILSNSINTKENIILVEKDEIISEGLCLATTFNKYFANITAGLSIPKWYCNDDTTIVKTTL